MRIFHFELRKILSWRPFWLITAVLLIINGYIIIKQQNESLNSPANYTSLYDEIKDIPDNEKLDYIQNKLDTFWDNTENIEKSDIMSRYVLLLEFQKQLENITGYADYIESAAKSSGSNIFNIDKNSFAYKSNQKTAAAYSDMNDVKPVFDISEGILLVTDSKITDMMCVFLLFIAAICLIVRDKECGITPLIRSASNGRSVLAYNQSLVILILSLIIVTFFYCENILIGLVYYGFGDLLRPIQSVSGFIACNLHLNVLSYLIIYYLTKVFTLWIIGMIFAVICLCSKNNVVVYALSVFISGMEVCAWAFISETSVFSLLHFINPVNFICVNDVFKKYTCINILNVPFSAIAVMYFSMTVILVLLNILYICISGRIKNISYKNISVLNRLSSLLNLKNHQFTSFGYTVYNSMIVQKSVFVLIGFIVIVSAISISIEKSYDINDMYYNYYCTQLEEKNNEEISAFIENETERYTDLHDKLNKLVSNDGSVHEIESLEKQLEPESAFQKVSSKAAQLSELNEDNTDIFYDTGYERFFSFESQEILVFALLKTVIIILLISPLFAFNNMYGLNKVIFSTAFGKQHYIISNVILTFIYSVLVSVAMDLSFFFKIIDEYGIQGIDKSVYSIGVFDGFPINMTLKYTIIMVIVFKAAMTFLMSLLILFISYYSRSISSSALISLLLFAVPVLIAVLNIKSFVSVGFTPYITGTKVILDFNAEMIIAPFLVIVFIFGFIIRRKTSSKK